VTALRSGMLSPPVPGGDGAAGGDGEPAQRRELRLREPVHRALSLGALRHGRFDPCVRIEGRTLWRATRTPEGPATEAVVVDPAGGVATAWAWGPGAAWVLDGFPALLGAGDGLADFEALVAGDPGPRRPPGWDAVVALARRWPGVRIPRTAAVVEACVPTVLEQKVTGLEARRSYRDLVVALGAPAPGPAARVGIRLPPSPQVLAATPGWAMHRFGIERKRADTIRRVGAAARRLEEAAAMDRGDGRRRLTAIPGLGAWSAAEVAIVALGDPDAVSVGDYHLPNQVAWALAGEARGDDRRMLELLEPWRGHRGRVLRLLVAAGITAPKYGPRLAVRSFRDR
jgi:3-methyladenine DNA glycosylase/8-oxoguanine DNA glycosylase